MGCSVEPKLSTHAHTRNIKSWLRQFLFSECFLVNQDPFPLLEPHSIDRCSEFLWKNPFEGPLTTDLQPHPRKQLMFQVWDWLRLPHPVKNHFLLGPITWKEVFQPQFLLVGKKPTRMFGVWKESHSSPSPKPTWILSSAAHFLLISLN